MSSQRAWVSQFQDTTTELSSEPLDLKRASLSTITAAQVPTRTGSHIQDYLVMARPTRTCTPWPGNFLLLFVYIHTLLFVLGVNK